LNGQSQLSGNADKLTVMEILIEKKTPQIFSLKKNEIFVKCFTSKFTFTGNAEKKEMKSILVSDDILIFSYCDAENYHGYNLNQSIFGVIPQEFCKKHVEFENEPDVVQSEGPTHNIEDQKLSMKRSKRYLSKVYLSDSTDQDVDDILLELEKNINKIENLASNIEKNKSKLDGSNFLNNKVVKDEEILGILNENEIEKQNKSNKNTETEDNSLIQNHQPNSSILTKIG